MEKETSSASTALPPGGSKRPSRILVVDDEKAVRNLNSEVLTDAGYEVMGVADGALAWEAIQAQHFDLMITDNSMPKVTGVELISKVVAANIRLPVIMATGALPIHEFKRHPWLNNIAVLEKPISNSALLSIVEKVLYDGKDIPNEKVAPKELAAAKIEGAPPEIVSKDRRTDKAEASSDEAAARSDGAEAPSEPAEIRNMAALRSSEIRYRRLFEAARDGILILNVENGRITDVNPYLVEILGFPRVK